MCELLGMNFNTKVNPRISFKGFRQRGKKNPDGWGLAFYADKSCQIFKEEHAAGKSALSAFLEGYSKIRSEIIIGHVRLASRGNISRQNTIPSTGNCTAGNSYSPITAHSKIFEAWRLDALSP